MLTATIDATSLSTLDTNDIALTLAGAGANLSFDEPNQPEQLLNTNAAALSGQSTDFTLAVTVPSTIEAGVYVINIGYNAVDNAPAQPLTMSDPTLRSFCANSMSIFPDTTNGPNEITLTDTRDGKQYRVRKLKNNLAGTSGRCWMVDNLALAGSASGVTLTDADTNLESVTSFILGGEVHNTATHSNGICNGSGTGPGTAWLTCNGAYVLNTDNLSFSAYTDTAYSTEMSSWCTNHPTDWPIGTTTGCGYLYNFYTATAGGLFDTDGIAPNSICPLRWGLPSGGLPPSPFVFFSDYNGLDVAYGGDGIGGGTFAFANLWDSAGAYAGVFSGAYLNSLQWQGNSSEWWSATMDTAGGIGAFAVSAASYNVEPATGFFANFFGLAIRCVLL